VVKVTYCAERAGDDAPEQPLPLDERLVAEVAAVKPREVVRDEERRRAAEEQRAEIGTTLAVEADKLAVQNADAAD